MLEEKIRTALRAEGERLNQVGPLRLPSAPAAVGARPVRRAAGRGGGRTRTWLAPAAAAAMVAVVAVALVTVRSARNDTQAAAKPPPAAATVPRYGVGLTAFTSQGLAQGMVVTDTLSGATVASIPAPKGASYIGVSGAADDRTFAVGTTLARDPSLPAHPSTGPTGWYLLRISPGSPDPARLTMLPLPASARDAPVGLLALSPSGTKIAMLSGNVPGSGPIIGYKGWLRVYSVTTGQLLRAWSAGFSPDGDFGVVAAMTWIHGDSGLALTVEDETTIPVRQEVRVMDMATGDASGNTGLAVAAAAGGAYPGAADLLTNSRVAWSLAGELGSCGPPTLTRDGSTLVCISQRQARDGHTDLLCLAYQVSAPRTPHVVARIGTSPHPPMIGATVLWMSSDGRTVLVAWVDVPWGEHESIYSPSALHIGVASGGRLTPLPSNPIVPPLAAQFGNTVAL